jgi:hypothetical protein
MADDETPRQSDAHPHEGEGEEPPPFKPDPRLVTYLERGRKDDAPKKFRRAIEELRDRTP